MIENERKESIAQSITLAAVITSVMLFAASVSVMLISYIPEMSRTMTSCSITLILGAIVIIGYNYANVHLSLMTSYYSDPCYWLQSSLVRR